MHGASIWFTTPQQQLVHASDAKVQVFIPARQNLLAISAWSRVLNTTKVSSKQSKSNFTATPSTLDTKHAPQVFGDNEPGIFSKPFNDHSGISMSSAECSVSQLPYSPSEVDDAIVLDELELEKQQELEVFREFEEELDKQAQTKAERDEYLGREELWPGNAPAINSEEALELDAAKTAKPERFFEQLTEQSMFPVSYSDKLYSGQKPNPALARAMKKFVNSRAAPVGQPRKKEPKKAPKTPNKPKKPKKAHKKTPEVPQNPKNPTRPMASKAPKANKHTAKSKPACNAKSVTGPQVEKQKCTPGLKQEKSKEIDEKCLAGEKGSKKPKIAKSREYTILLDDKCAIMMPVKSIGSTR